MISRIATDADQMEFDNAYWAAQPPPVQKLRDMDQGVDRKMAAAILASYNYHIDEVIMAWGWDAYKTMALRLSFGYTWTPSLRETNVQIAPGTYDAFQGLKPYDPKTPSPLAFKVSLDFADYLPFQA